MNYLLKAMGFWIWGLVAIVISAAVVTVSYRTIASHRPPDDLAENSAAPINGSTPFEPKASAVGVRKETTAAALDVAVISRTIRKEMSAAQSAMQRGQWADVLGYVDAAESKGPLSSYDVGKIEEFRGYSRVKLKDFKAAQAAYEAAAATGAFKAEELARIFHLLFQLAAQNGDNMKALEYSKKVVADGKATPNDLLVIGQIYYLQKDCKDSAIWGDKAMAASKDAGEAPKEVLYQMQLQCASDVNNTDGMLAALYELVRLTNKTSYWNNLIRLERQGERDDHNTLMIYRVMYDTHSMLADTDYIEMAQLLGDAGLPGEARRVLEQTMRANLLKDEHKERVLRMLESVKTRADADDAALRSLSVAAGNSATGSWYVRLAQINFGAGLFDEAESAARLGLAKGEIDRLDDAYVTLGRSLIAQRNLPAANKAFAKLGSVPGISPRVLRLWNLYAETTAPTVASASL
jgi:tetratricopeptide (TPR) repeat protein